MRYEHYKEEYQRHTTNIETFDRLIDRNREEASSTAGELKSASERHAALTAAQNQSAPSAYDVDALEAADQEVRGLREKSSALDVQHTDLVDGREREYLQRNQLQDDNPEWRQRGMADGFHPASPPVPPSPPPDDAVNVPSKSGDPTISDQADLSPAGGARTKQEWLDWVREQPAENWNAPKDRSVAVLYSGYQGKNFESAKADCDAPDSPRYRIEQTTAGQQLDQAKLFDQGHSGLPEREAREVWGAASGCFARQINGPMETHVVSSDKESIARATEVPAILSSTNATTINGIPTSELNGLSDRDKYYQIAEAEVAQAHARAADDPTLAARAADKEAGLQAVHARDMSVDAQRLAARDPDDLTVPATTSKYEAPVAIPSADNDNIPSRQRLFLQGTGSLSPQAPADRIAGPRDDLHVPTQGWENDNHPRGPKPVPSPNESFEALSESTKASMPAPGPSDSIPAASSAPVIANDNSMPGP